MESLARLSILTVFVVSSSVVHAGPTGDINGVETATALRLHPLLSCLRETDTTGCIQKRAFRYLEDWLVRGEEAAGLDRSDEDLATLPPYLARIIDSLADGISTWWTGGPDDDDARRLKATGSNSLEEEGLLRGHKKKKEKLTKIATTVILLILYFIKSQLFYMFDHVVRTGIFAGFALIAKLFVILKFVELKRYLWWIKEDKKEFYHHEVSHHDHHYDHEHYNHDHPWWGGWPWSSRALGGSDLAYRAHAQSSTTTTPQSA